MSNLLRAYLFRSKDPEIDIMRTLIEDEFGRRVNRKDLKKVEEAGGPKVGTTCGWFFGDTRRPQNATLEATGRSIGYRRQWVKLNGKHKP